MTYGTKCKSNVEVDDDNGFHDSEYNFNSEEDASDKENGNAGDDAEKTIEDATSIP